MRSAFHSAAVALVPDEELLARSSSWEHRRHELNALAGQLLDTHAVQRLGSISFLGILSPRFASRIPELARAGIETESVSDGSRLDHSMGVALLCVDVARSFGFSFEAQRYAAIWGLLHDLGNWPLSHSGEHAFRQLTGTTPRALRRDLITGARGVPTQLIVEPELRALRIDLDLLISLIEYRLAELPPDLRALAEVMQSPLSPDAFEGMWRCGQVIGENVADPESLANALRRSSNGTIQLRSGCDSLVLDFWRSKIHIYEHFLNSSRIVRLESSWSQAIERELAGITLADSLSISEEDLVTRVLAGGLSSDPPFSRYKPPVQYALALPANRPFPTNATLSQVAAILVSKPLHA
jgi:HD superfamily phosphohydrolase